MHFSWRLALGGGCWVGMILCGVHSPQAQVSSSESFGETSARSFVRSHHGAENWIVEQARSREVIEAPGSERFPSDPMTSRSAPRIRSHRPYQGALSGMVVYLLGGHGRTYMEENLDWLTQRSPSFGLVEDYGNQDQASIFAELALRAGATVAPLRPIHHQPNERIQGLFSPGSKLHGLWWKTQTSKTFHGPRYGQVTGAWTRVNMKETAVARWEPFIPEDGFYPVYVWAPSGPDRAIARYRIHHAEGIDEVPVPHRLVGHSWVYLGRYYFPKGWGHGVELSNQAVDPLDAELGRIVQADTVRFGNGLGDKATPGGISGYCREDEASIYWMARSVAAGEPSRLHSLGMDRNKTIGAPPRFAAYMNRETEGRFSDRVYLSFHSNAAGSRGALGLWNRDPEQRPDFQEQLAEILGRVTNVGLQQENLPGLPIWSRRTRHQLNHINFGELRRDNIQNEMSSTILETAFFDQPEDAQWLTDPRGLTLFAQASVNGLIEWKRDIESPDQALLLPPSSPDSVSVFWSAPGVLEIRHKPGPEGSLRGGPATEIVVEFSRSGRNFGRAVSLGSDSGTTVSVPSRIPANAPVYLRLRAKNAAGSSLPTPVVAVAPLPPGLRTNLPPRDILIIECSLAGDSSQNVRQTEVFGRRPENYSSVQRVRPMELLDSLAQVRRGQTLAGEGFGFDTVAPQIAAERSVDFSRYRLIYVDTGTVLKDFQPISGALARKLLAHTRRGGKVLVTGRNAAEILAQDGGPGSDLLRTGFGTQTLAEPVRLSRGVRWPSEGDFPRAEFSRESSQLPALFPASSLVPLNSGREVLRWSNRRGGAAAVAGPHGVLAAFPLGSIESESHRGAVLRALLLAAGIVR